MYKTTYELWDYLLEVLALPTVYADGGFGQVKDGKFLYDCICVIKSFPWCFGKAGGQPYYKANNVEDDWIGAFYEKAQKKSDDMSQLPKSGIYLVYYNNSHVGVYNADTQTVIEAAGGSTGKVVERPYSYYETADYQWNKWSELYWCPNKKINTNSSLKRDGEPTAPQTLYCVQVGAYRQRENAEEMLKKIQKAGFNGFIFTKQE